jgi:hypothetical protein
MKTLVSLAIAAALATSAQAGEIAKPSWADYRSTVVNKPVNIEVDSRVDTRIDKSKKIEDSYNTDKSKKIHDSYNTDNSHKAVGSYNTAIDKQALNARLDSTKNIATLDTQSANNNASMVGPTQLGLQGGFSGGNLSSTGPTTSIGAGDGSRVFMKQTRELTQSNYTEVGGANYGAISSLNVGHQGDGDLTMGPKGSIVGSRLGNDQTFVTGDQTQVQGNEQHKQSQTSSSASDTTTVSASK